MNEPTINEWRELYQTASAFAEAAPWAWMLNEDIFAVVNPLNGEVGYCSILGHAGEEFGLGVFLGNVGLRHLAALVTGEQEAEDPEEAIMTPLLMFLLASRNELQEEDRQVIRSLNLNFRGRDAWPIFRSQRPGYAPWFLEKDEVIYLTAALRQALEIANRVRCGELDLRRRLRGEILTRYLAGNAWREEWQPVPITRQDPTTAQEPLGAVNEARLHLLGSGGKDLSGSWELDIFVVPVHIGPRGSRPYYPLCFMAVERRHGLIVFSNMTQPWLTLSEKREELIRLLEEANTLPSEVWVRSPKMRQTVEPITRALGMTLRVGRLPMLQEAKSSLCDYLSRRRG